MKHDLAARIIELHTWTADPFGTFVVETLRAMGYPYPLPDPPEEPELVAGLEAARREYFQAVAREAPFTDVLGPVFEEVSSHGRRKRAGQFFTPWDVALLMAQIAVGETTPDLNPADDAGLWRVHEPAVGSGATVLALLYLLVHRHGPAVLRHWSIQAVDVDLTLARTFALQACANLAGRSWTIGELQVIHGDTLRLEQRSLVFWGTAKPQGDAPIDEDQGGQLRLFAA